MLLKARKKFILAKEEGTYGTDAVPTGAANAIETRNLEVTPIQAELVAQNIDRGTLGGEVQLHVGIHHTLQFEVGLAGSGAAGTAPAYGDLLEICGHSETVVASTSVTYAPIDTAIKSASIRFHADGEFHNFLGCRGSVGLALDADGIPVWRFSIVGLYVAPSAVADPVADLSNFIDPIPVSQSQTTFTLDGFTCNGKAFNFDLNGQVDYLSLTEQESVEFTDRAPGGSIEIARPEIGTKDFYALAVANSLIAAQVVHGTTAGNIFTFDGAGTQLLQPTFGEHKGISMLNMNLAFVPTTGNPDYQFTFT